MTDATQFTVCPKCAGELIIEIRCDGRCGKVWKVEELERLLVETVITDAGPWRSENICDDNREWGPCVWDSRVDEDGYGVAGVSLFYFTDLIKAEAVRDVLNRLEK